MKHLYLYVALLSFCCFPVKMQAQGAIVDERVELTNIVFGLAGIPEYSVNPMRGYTEEVKEYFKDYEEHPIFEHIWKMRSEGHVSYGRIIGTAFCLNIKNGRVLADTVSVTLEEAGEGQWSKENFEIYVKLLDDFYRKSDFHRFFIRNKELYKEAKSVIDYSLDMIRPEWFESFIGQSLEMPDVYVMTNSINNFSFVPDKDTKIPFSIFLSYNGQDSLMFYYQGFPLVLHEIMHFYSDSIALPYFPQVEQSIAKMSEQVWDKMAKLAIGTHESVFTEWFTEFLTIAYLNDNNPDIFRQSLMRTTYTDGFFWTLRLWDFLKEHFYADNETYATITDFMPRIAECINFTGNDMEHVIAECEHNIPYVTSVYPLPGSDLATYGKVDSITVKFSIPMNKATGVANLKTGEGVTPFINAMAMEAYWKDSTTLVIPIFSIPESGTCGIILDKWFTQSVNWLCLKEDYVIEYFVKNKN